MMDQQTDINLHAAILMALLSELNPEQCAVIIDQKKTCEYGSLHWGTRGQIEEQNKLGDKIQSIVDSFTENAFDRVCSCLVTNIDSIESVNRDSVARLLNAYVNIFHSNKLVWLTDIEEPILKDYVEVISMIHRQGRDRILRVLETK